MIFFPQKSIGSEYQRYDNNMDMKLNEPWIDPTTCDMDSILNKNEFHIVYLMRSDNDTFQLVTSEELVLAHSQTPSEYTTNMVPVSIGKLDVNGINQDGKIQTSALPRIKIDVDSIFVNLDDLTKKIKSVYEYFEFI